MESDKKEAKKAQEGNTSKIEEGIKAERAKKPEQISFAELEKRINTIIAKEWNTSKIEGEIKAEGNERPEEGNISNIIAKKPEQIDFNELIKRINAKTAETIQEENTSKIEEEIKAERAKKQEIISKIDEKLRAEIDEKLQQQEDSGKLETFEELEERVRTERQERSNRIEEELNRIEEEKRIEEAKRRKSEEVKSPNIEEAIEYKRSEEVKLPGGGSFVIHHRGIQAKVALIFAHGVRDPSKENDYKHRIPPGVKEVSFFAKEGMMLRVSLYEAVIEKGIPAETLGASNRRMHDYLLSGFTDKEGNHLSIPLKLLNEDYKSSFKVTKESQEIALERPINLQIPKIARQLLDTIEFNNIKIHQQTDIVEIVYPKDPSKEPIDVKLSEVIKKLNEMGYKKIKVLCCRAKVDTKPTKDNVQRIYKKESFQERFKRRKKLRKAVKKSKYKTFKEGNNKKIYKKSKVKKLEKASKKLGRKTFERDKKEIHLSTQSLPIKFNKTVDKLFDGVRDHANSTLSIPTKVPEQYILEKPKKSLFGRVIKGAKIAGKGLVKGLGKGVVIIIDNFIEGAGYSVGQYGSGVEFVVKPNDATTNSPFTQKQLLSYQEDKIKREEEIIEGEKMQEIRSKEIIGGILAERYIAKEEAQFKLNTAKEKEEINRQEKRQSTKGKFTIGETQSQNTENPTSSSEKEQSANSNTALPSAPTMEEVFANSNAAFPSAPTMEEVFVNSNTAFPSAPTMEEVFANSNAAFPIVPTEEPYITRQRTSSKRTLHA